MRSPEYQPEPYPAEETDRSRIRGEVRQPRAMPSALVWTSILIVAGVVLVLVVVRLTSEPEDRAPLPATPPESLEPADGSPVD